MKIAYICFAIFIASCGAKHLFKAEEAKPHMTGTTCGSRPPQYQAMCYRSKGQKVPQSALDAEKKHGPMQIRKPKQEKHHKTGTTCGSRPPQYQADCYRSRGQKVPQSALDAEKKHGPTKIRKPKQVKPHKTGTTCGSRPPQYQADCYRSRGQKVPQSALDAEKKRGLKKIRKPKQVKPHKTGTTCGSRPPQYQADCYRSRGQKVPKSALEAEKKYKQKKVKQPKISGLVNGGLKGIINFKRGTHYEDPWASTHVPNCTATREAKGAIHIVDNYYACMPTPINHDQDCDSDIPNGCTALPQIKVFKPEGGEKQALCALVCKGQGAMGKCAPHFDCVDVPGNLNYGICAKIDPSHKDR